MTGRPTDYVKPGCMQFCLKFFFIHNLLQTPSCVRIDNTHTDNFFYFPTIGNKGQPGAWGRDGSDGTSVKGRQGDPGRPGIPGK